MAELEFTYGLFKEFLISKGVELPEKCPACGNKEKWDYDKREPNKTFGRQTYEDISHILRSPSYSRADFGNFMVECGNCGYNMSFILAAFVEDWHSKNG